MDATTFESDSLLKLLTDALRRGPGTPEWHDAIEHLKRDGVAGADEYRLLLTVRERLESGQEYRSVRAGPAFTRELFDKIDSETVTGKGSSHRPVTTLGVAVVCLVVLVGSIGLLVNYLSKVSRLDTGDGDRLASQLFLTPVRTWSLTGNLPNDLKRAGTMKLDPYGGIRPARESGDGSEVGVVYSEVPISLTAAPVCVEMQVRYQPGPASLQMLLGRSTQLDDTAANGAAFGLSCESAGIRVIGGSAASDERPLPAGVHTVRLKVSGDNAIAEVNGQQIWAGQHSLGQQAFVAVRVVKTGKAQGGIAVQSLRVLAP